MIYLKPSYQEEKTSRSPQTLRLSSEPRKKSSNAAKKKKKTTRNSTESRRKTKSFRVSQGLQEKAFQHKEESQVEKDINISHLTQEDLKMKISK